VQVRRHLESEDCLVTGRVRALRLDLRAELNRPSATLSNSALLRPLRSRATWENAGLHGGERVIADKDEVGGSTPPRPTTHRRRSQRCRQRARSVRCRLGPRWGRTPIPAGTSSGPSGSAHPGVRLGDDHAPWSRTQPRTPAHAAGAATSRCSLLPCPPRSRPRRALRTPAWPAWALSGHARPLRPAPTRQPGSATDLPLTNATSAASPTSPPEVGGDGRVRMDGWAADGWTLDGWTADGRPPDPLDDDPR
jgi:hypothetical protein